MTILLSILALPVISVAAFAWWLKRGSNIDIEKGVKCWDVFVKLISTFTVVVSGAMLFGKYIDQQGQLQSQRAVQEQNELSGRAEITSQFRGSKLALDLVTPIERIHRRSYSTSRNS